MKIPLGLALPVLLAIAACAPQAAAPSASPTTAPTTAPTVAATVAPTPTSPIPTVPAAVAVEVPVKGAALQKVIQRQAQQQKVFAGEAAWASQTSPPGKGLQRVVLHLFPRLLLNQLIQGCKQNGLHLTAVIPPSAVLTNALGHQRAPSDL